MSKENWDLVGLTFTLKELDDALDETGSFDAAVEKLMRSRNVGTMPAQVVGVLDAVLRPSADHRNQRGACQQAGDPDAGSGDGNGVA